MPDDPSTAHHLVWPATRLEHVAVVPARATPAVLRGDRYEAPRPRDEANPEHCDADVHDRADGGPAPHRVEYAESAVPTMTKSNPESSSEPAWHPECRVKPVWHDC